MELLRRCRYPLSARADETAAMVFEERDSQWVLVATNTDHPLIQERDALRRLRSIGA